MSVSCTYRLLFCEFHDSRDHFSRFSLKYQLERIFETASRYSDVTGAYVNTVLQPVGIFPAVSSCSLRDLVFYHAGRGAGSFERIRAPAAQTLSVARISGRRRAILQKISCFCQRAQTKAAPIRIGQGPRFYCAPFIRSTKAVLLTFSSTHAGRNPHRRALRTERRLLHAAQ